MIDLAALPKNRALQVELYYTKIVFQDFWIKILGNTAAAHKEQRRFIRQKLRAVRNKYSS